MIARASIVRTGPDVARAPVEAEHPEVWNLADGMASCEDAAFAVDHPWE